MNDNFQIRKYSNEIAAIETVKTHPKNEKYFIFLKK